MLNQKNATQQIPSLQWHRLDSSCLLSCAFDQQTGTLYIRFHSNCVYRYAECHRTVMERLLIAESTGAYYNQFIKNLYPTERVA